MAKYCLKKPSKRLTSRKKFKIQKKVKEHSKKLRKLDKESAKKQAKKSISVPNKCPFKEEMLMEAEKKREQRKEEEQIRKKKQLKKPAMTAKGQHKQLKKHKALTMESLAEKAAQEGEAYNENQFLVETLPEKLVEEGNAKTVKTYAAEVRKTIEDADILIEVLDARDPLGSRSSQIEKLVLESGKRLVLLLNKIDLVPRENLQKWLTYLRQQLPTIAFKASTQEQNQKLGRISYANLTNGSLSSSKCIGADLVMKLLGNYCRNKDIKTNIRVGIIGFPNVGKSSVINSLKRKKSCQTGATPGLTKQMQEVELDKHIRLLDSPGVVLAPKGQLDDPSELSLKNVVRVETLVDPIMPIRAILRRCSVKVLMLHYKIPEFDDCEQFLALLSRRFGRLKKGGLPNLNAAAKQVLNDWNSGNLRYYTEPPESKADSMEQQSAEDQQLVDAVLVSEFSKEFDLDALDQDIRTIVAALPEDHMAVDTLYDPTVPIQSEKSVGECGEELMETDQPAHGKVVLLGGPAKKSGGTNATGQKQQQDFLPESLAIGDGNVQLGRAIKKAVKKQKKRQQKIVKKAENLDKLVVGMELE